MGFLPSALWDNGEDWGSEAGRKKGVKTSKKSVPARIHSHLFADRPGEGFLFVCLFVFLR
jgi:hypothetical protein